MSTRKEQAIAAIEGLKSKPTIPAVVGLFADYHAREPVWGALHIVLEDGNVREDDVRYCLDAAVKSEDDDAEILAHILLRMSPTQRRKLPGAVERREQSKPHIVKPEPVEAVEAEESTPATIYDFRKIVAEHWPLLTPDKQEAQARKMLERHPFIERAYRAGLRQGRDLRERSSRGLGWIPWPEMEVLAPNERGFVMAKVREAIGVAQ